MLKVNEIFFSIQGESTFAGLPFVFVRLSRCNLRCQYCDTPYAYDEGREMFLSEIIERVEQFPCDFVEITGGEPLLQAEVFELAARLVSAGKIVLVETNGTLDITPLRPPIIRIVDVKCPGSGEGESFLLTNLRDLRPSDNVKFVLSDKADFDWAVNFVKKNDLTGKCPLLFSPVFGKLNYSQLAEWIKSSGLPIQLQIQLHKIIWDEGKRGV
ncbi:MAG: radical SAM protein [Calditrichaeota bacterium]|nr:radical SAM protein [Calditrichota bacterium]